MTNSELTAYNYGRRLAAEAITLAREGRQADMPAAAILSPEETNALERLGQARWWSLVTRGGQEVLGSSDAVPPLQT